MLKGPECGEAQATGRRSLGSSRRGRGLSSCDGPLGLSVHPVSGLARQGGLGPQTGLPAARRGASPLPDQPPSLRTALGGVASRMRKLSCGECVPCRHGRPGFGLGLPDLAAAQAGPPGPPRYRRAGSVRGPFFSRPTFLAASWPPSPRGGPCHQALLLSCSSLPPHHLGPGALGSSPTQPQPTVHRATLGWRGQGANL